MPDLTPDLAELERLLAEATPGPWQADEATQTGQRATVAFPVVLSESTGEILLECDWGGDTDAALIVAAVNALPALLAERERLQERYEAVCWALDNACAQRETFREVARFAKHDPGCANPPARCTCGLTALAEGAPDA